MKILVQKYGGSSLADPEKVRAVARRVAARRREGWTVVVVVSAMGDTTSELLEMARAVCDAPARRELDVLLSSGEQVSRALLGLALHDLGIEAVSLTGPQSGILTDDRHTCARILEVRPTRVLGECVQGRTVIVAGYQGMSPSGEVTTLGRGGSDTSAVALAAALGAKRCEICSDVDGVYSADPRVVPRAFRLPAIDYEEMHELAVGGARVLHAESVDFARRHGLEIRARASFNGDGGTVVRKDVVPGPGPVRGLAARRDLIRVQTHGGGTALGREVHGAVGSHAVAERTSDAGDVDLLLVTEDIPDVESWVRDLRGRFVKRSGFRVATGIGSVKLVGSGIGADHDLLRSAADRLRRHGTPVLSTWTSPHGVTCALRGPAVEDGCRVLHEAFVEAEPRAGIGA